MAGFGRVLLSGSILVGEIYCSKSCLMEVFSYVEVITFGGLLYFERMQGVRVVGGVASFGIFGRRTCIRAIVF